MRMHKLRAAAQKIRDCVFFRFGGLWKGLQFTSVVPTFIPWLMRHGDAATLPIVEEALKEGRAWATAKGNGRLGAVGFCFGGRYSILAAGGAEPRVDAYVAVHPSQVGVPADVDAVRRPGLFVLAEVDPRFSGRLGLPPELWPIRLIPRLLQVRRWRRSSASLAPELWLPQSLSRIRALSTALPSAARCA